MNALITGVAIFASALFFVNIVLFGMLKIPLSSIPLGELLLIEAVFAGFFLFLFLVLKKKV